MKKEESKKTEELAPQEEGLYPVIVNPFKRGYKTLELSLHETIVLHNILGKIFDKLSQDDTAVVKPVINSLEKVSATDIGNICLYNTDFKSLRAIYSRQVQQHWEEYNAHADEMSEKFRKEDLPF